MRNFVSTKTPKNFTIILDRQQRHHRRQIVGWWLDVAPAALHEIDHGEIDNHFSEIVEKYNKIVENDEHEHLVARGAHATQRQMQLSRMQKVLDGKRVIDIASEEFTDVGSVRASIRYSLARLAILTRGDQL